MADYQYLTPSGVIVEDTSTILTGVQTEYKTAFGNGLVVTPDTPQGVLITAETLARSEVLANNAALANQINPNIAGGIFLDAILALTGMQRTSATHTLVKGVAVTGIPNTIIQNGTKAKTAAGDEFETLSTIILDISGNGSVDFASVAFGAITCAISALNTIVTNILGWETVSNPVAGIVGTTTQSDIGARSLRVNTLGFQGVALPVAITSALYAVDGVQSLWFQENVTGSTTTINGISMTSHSIYVCVNGGADVDVASALLENKSSGANWIGGTTVNVIEPASGQSYAVKFARPTPIAVLAKVTTTNGDAANIKAAILAYVNGELSGEDGFIVGGDVSPWELAGAINRQYPSTFLSKVEVSFASSVSYTTNVLAIAVSEIATLDAAGITVIIA